MSVNTKWLTCINPKSQFFCNQPPLVGMNGEIRPPLTPTQNRDSRNQAGDISLGGPLREGAVINNEVKERYLAKHNLAHIMAVWREAFIRKWRPRQRASLPTNCFLHF
ncbi:hypothetical protein CEXT_311771 [Caerostris extrusa]|uniref:Uncharacterized protein n=1 Tax=Caerostris extrusa TaxID=172846 RepID=A0AAV4YB71_CAEEX|nr:hypothetical protein CEXT_311771 [Caerostris extrusa]